MAHRLLRTPGRYTGWLWEGIWRAPTRRWLKRLLHKADRRHGQRMLAADLPLEAADLPTNNGDSNVN